MQHTTAIKVSVTLAWLETFHFDIGMHETYRTRWKGGSFGFLPSSAPSSSLFIPSALDSFLIWNADHLLIKYKNWMINLKGTVHKWDHSMKKKVTCIMVSTEVLLYPGIFNAWHEHTACCNSGTLRCPVFKETKENPTPDVSELQSNISKPDVRLQSF